MSLEETIRRQGRWLFRRRSFLPLLAIIVLPLGLIHYHYPGGSHTLDQLWEVGCLLISLLGMAIRIYTVGHAPPGTSGRSTRRLKATSLNTTGMYSVVRHPLYLGNFFMGLGISMFLHNALIPLIYVACFWIYYERIMFAEEAFLRDRFGEAFEKWAAQTPTFIPRPTLWRPPALPFDLRRVLRKEHHGFFALTLSFFILEFLSDLMVEHHPHLDAIWVALLIVGTLSYAILWFMKKKDFLI